MVWHYKTFGSTWILVLNLSAAMLKCIDHFHAFRFVTIQFWNMPTLHRYFFPFIVSPFMPSNKPSYKAEGPSVALEGPFLALLIFCYYFLVQEEEPKEDYSHLPPNQQKKKLQEKIDSLRTSLAKHTAARLIKIFCRMLSLC